jgi:hypothetical protein
VFGNVVLLIPRFRRGLCAKWLQPRLKKPYFRLSLDEVGSFVWEQCDGKMTVREIAALMAARFGENVQPVENRLSIFFATLFRNKVVRYWQTAA